MGTYKKYPRTHNLSFSKSESSDDIWNKNENNFVGKEIVCLMKADGENTTFYNNHCHARSIDSMHSHHPSRSYVKQIHASVKHLIPNNVRICGENVYAKHAIYYPALTSYFYVFAVFEGDACVSWDDTVEWCQKLGLEHVPVLYRGLWCEKTVRSCWPHSCFGEVEGEGCVVRLAGSFYESDFGVSVGKWVRENHVQTNKHWMNQQIIKNKLKDEYKMPDLH